MLAPVALRVAALSWIAAGMALAQPIKAGNNLIYPTNPPQKASSDDSTGEQMVAKGLLAQIAKSQTAAPPEFKIERFDAHPPDKGEVTASLAIAYTQDHPANAKDVKVICYVYDKLKDGTIQMTKRRTSSKWASPPVDWANKTSEELILSCPAPSDPDVSYAGMVIGVYYRNQLQDLRSFPEILIKDFPLPNTIYPQKAPPYSKEPNQIFVQSYRSLLQAALAVQAKDPDYARKLLDRAINDLKELRENRSDWEPPVVQDLLDKALKEREALK